MNAKWSKCAQVLQVLGGHMVYKNVIVIYEKEYNEDHTDIKLFYDC